MSKRTTVWGEIEDKPEPTRLEAIKARVAKATPGPWGPYAANTPFNAIITKPAPSLSKHDAERATYWRIDDAVFVANAVEDMKYLLSLLEESTK